MNSAKNQDSILSGTGLSDVSHSENNVSSVKLVKIGGLKKTEISQMDKNNNAL